MLWLNQSSYPEDKPEKSEVSAKNLYNRPTASYYSNSVSVLINKTWWVSQSNAAYRRVFITNICRDPQVISFCYLQSSDFIFGAVNEQNKPGMPSGIFSFILGYKVN